VLEPTIAVLSDQNLFREEILQLLHRQGFRRVTEHCSAAELLGTLASDEPQLLLIDLDHTAEDPLPLLRELRQRAPQATVVLLGGALQSEVARDDEPLSESRPFQGQVLSAIASLSLRSDVEEDFPSPPPLDAQQRHQLWSTMTPRQRDVLGHLSTGSDNLKIAAHLGISERAVKAHVSALLTLFNAENRTELAVLACRAGMRPPLHLRPKPTTRPLPQPRSA
jgi:DNA-binding NarL/FixJ family response regulator